MNRSAIQHALTQNHAAFVDYMHGLSEADFLFRNGTKWTAGQQLQHIVVCVKPLVQVLNMPKPMIAENFGVSNRSSISVEEHVRQYEEKLAEGGKAPSRFVPEEVHFNQRAELCDQLTQLVAGLNAQLETFSEAEMDHFCIPHPLLGAITLREMMYNAFSHVEHHHTQAKLNLEAK